MAIDQPCEPWDIDFTCCPTWIPQDTPVVEPDTDGVAARLAAQAFALSWASTFLWKRSGRRFGVCSRTVRICPPSCYCFDICKCGPRSVLALSLDAPIVAVQSVTNVCSNTVIDSSRYRIVNGSSLGLVDMSCGWLVGVDCELEIVFTAGWTPDEEATLAASELACAFVKKCLDTECRSDSFLSLAAGFHKVGSQRGGRRTIVLTGIPLVDQWLIEVGSAGATGMLDPSNPLPYVLS